MHVAELWRYPVKSLAGERLSAADLAEGGVAGDRLVQVYDGRERVVTARTRPRLLGLHGMLGPGGEPTIDGHAWNSAAALAAVRAAAGGDVRLARFEGIDRFDVLPLLVATDGAIAAFAADGRRLRPNIVIGGVDGLAERGWEGRRLAIGDAVVALETLRQRCVMTTVDPDTLTRDPAVLRRIVREFGGRLALDARVVRPGRIAVGDPVTLD